jgi:macrolide phosphotransferase
MDAPNRIFALADKYGLKLTGDLNINEIGLDFQVVIAKEEHSNRSWVLRIPRRPDMFSRIQHEEKILSFVAPRLPVAVPDWRIVGSELIAYPLLEDKTAISLDAKTYDVCWNIDKDSDRFHSSFAEVLAALHSIPTSAARDFGVKIVSPQESRNAQLADLVRVKSEIGIGKHLEVKIRTWLDDDGLWPDFSTFIHGDLYVGHILADSTNLVTGIIDWSEAQVNDPAIDFAGHLNVFNTEKLGDLIEKYQKAGGRTWPRMIEHIQGRYNSSPLEYGLFALDNKSDEHLEQAKAQLGVG